MTKSAAVITRSSVCGLSLVLLAVACGSKGSGGVASSGVGDGASMSGASNGGTGGSSGNTNTDAGANNASGGGVSGDGSAGAAGASGETDFANDAGSLFGGNDGAALPHKVPYRALAVASGEFHSCALLDDHNVKCWGTNLYGQLGQGDGATRWLLTGTGDDLPVLDLGTGRTAVAISAGHYATCVILDNGSVKCWGYSGQLGIGAMGPVGDDPGEMGDALPTVDLGAGRTALKIAVGYAKACALLDDHNVRCWDNTVQPTFTVAGAPIVDVSSGYRPFALFADGTVGEMDSATRLDFGTQEPATSLFATDMGVCILLGTGTTVCQFRNNAERTETQPWSSPQLDALSLGALNGPYICGLFQGGSIKCWNRPLAPETWVDASIPQDDQGGVMVKLAQPAVAVTSGGSYYSCALLIDGQVQCWGDQGAFLGNLDVNNAGATIPLDLGSHWVP